jgi:hypothetical protein
MARWDNKHDSDNLKSMDHRGIEYTIVQGIGRDTWRWTVSLGNNISKSGQAIGKPEAVAQATRAINRAFALKRERLVPPGRGD